MVVNKKRMAGLILAVIFIAVCCSAYPKNKPAEKIEFPEEAVSRKVLDNGLTVLVKPCPPENLVAIDVKIRAGTSLEGEYLGSGISHFVEHMVFKGTKKRGPGQIEKEVKSYGGFMNGSASPDVTDYYITLPSGHFKEAIALLKDILLDASFEKKEFEKEREVILKEIRLNNDEPQSRLLRILNERAYLEHPYRYPTIGYESNFKKLSREDLIKYYEKMYVPNRLVITVVGGVDASSAIATVENEFKNFRNPDYRVAGINPAEPVQLGKRLAEESRDINLAYLAMGFHSTGLLHKDLFAMDVLAMILGRGNNSRLNTVLFKDKGMVHSVAAWNYTPRDPGLFVITAVLDKDKLGAAEDAVMEEIKKIKTGEIKSEELEAAKRMVISDYVFSRETIDAQASEIGSDYVLSGNYDFMRRYVEGIGAVTKSDVKRAADIYLNEDNLTIAEVTPVAISKKEKAKVEKPAAPKDIIRKGTLANGLRILVREDRKNPTVFITVAMLGGLMVENKDNNGISNLMANMLLKGTTTRSEDKITGAIENLGGSVAAFNGFNGIGLSMGLLENDLDAGLDILKDVLTNSVFPADQIDKEKSRILAAIRAEDEDIFQSGANLLRKEIFGPSPYGLRYIGEEKTVERLSRENLINLYRACCVPNNMVISVSGDVDSEKLISKLKDIFSDLKQGSIPAVPDIKIELDKIKTKNLEMEREESLIMMGFKGCDVKNPDRYALEVITSILSGQSGRVFNTLRNKLSLAYTLGCFHKEALTTGYFAFYIATTKEKMQESKRALLGEIKDIIKNPVTDDELILAKRELVSGYRLARQTNAFYSTNSALDELYGLGYDNLYTYEARIEKVTKEDIRQAANKYFDLNAYAEVMILSK